MWDYDRNRAKRCLQTKGPDAVWLPMKVAVLCLSGKHFVTVHHQLTPWWCFRCQHRGVLFADWQDASCYSCTFHLPEQGEFVSKTDQNRPLTCTESCKFCTRHWFFAQIQEGFNVLAFEAQLTNHSGCCFLSCYFAVVSFHSFVKPHLKNICVMLVKFEKAKRLADCVL